MTRIILTADKCVAPIVLDKADCIQKAENLLKQGGAYKTIAADPIKTQKNRLINLLMKIKAEGGINDILYRKMYPTGACAPKSYELQ